MGTIPEQTKGLVVNQEKPVFYEVKFRLSEIPEDRILKLDSQSDDDMMKWLYIVLANRRLCKEFNELKLAKRIMDELEQYDVIIGTIADGSIKNAVKSFARCKLTDNGLLACLSYADYGQQYVAKTEFACSKIDILHEHNITQSDRNSARQYESRQKAVRKGLIREIKKQYKNDGSYIDEIVESERRKERRSYEYE